MRLYIILRVACFHVVRGIPLPEPVGEPDNSSLVGEDLLEYE